ncbi:MAG TPA: PAS domain-containing sensor histidine kinase, partial [Clostridiaceae bacterium]|nr:PAS domain-containing sensor histidine kinase [Clostridiaceae bacterium]
KLKQKQDQQDRLAEAGEEVTDEATSGLAWEIKISQPEERTLEIYTAPFTADDTSEGVLFVIKDVTLIRHLEQIRTEFVSNVTHELKTPLTSIQGYLELLVANERDLATRQQFYQIMEIETDRLKNLIDDLLNLSEIEQAERSEHAHDRAVNLFTIVDDIIFSLAPQAEQRDVTIYNQLPVHLTYVANPIRMRQLFTNLISNAIKYNKDGGSVWISSSLARNRLELVVRDNGLGIPRDQHERLFERFYRVHKERSRELGGTGLGLSIVKHIVNLYDGSISLDSEPGEGTSFIILLPLI